VEKEGKGARLQPDDVQARNAVEVAEVDRADRVAEFKGTSSDDEIGQRESDSLGGLLGANAADNLGGRFRDGMDGDVCLQLIQELASHTGPLWRVGTINAVGEFRHGQRTDHDRDVAEPPLLRPLDASLACVRSVVVGLPCGSARVFGRYPRKLG